MTDTPGLEVSAVGARLAEVLDEAAWRDLSAALITGGKSNLTYRLSSAAGSVVLRRPPTGHILPKAHDMGREATVQRGLAQSAVPVAAILHEEVDESITGAPFYVMADVQGEVIRDVLPTGYADHGGREAMATALVDVLAALHTVDLDAAGLRDYGRPEGFMARQVARWTKQWELAKENEEPAVDELARRLAAGVPQAQSTAIVHGDYRIDNCIYDSADPGRIRAVLDWELSTLGDPLADLGMTLLYWAESGDPVTALVPSVTEQPGFPTRRELAERYAAVSGLDLTHLAFYEAFARLKFAAIAQGVSMRAKAGAMGGQDFSDHEGLAPALAEHGLAILDR
ncbi:phosphotransferase family protein [Demetria terragena]|uniref:phosphotransferase family protein n=1 Tax=Demetria terragena TaxID=63959 RepID=UPI00036F683E|nr:phosphotransferase family protein [Demetria terragena]